MNDEIKLFTEVYDKYYKQIFLYANYRCDYNEEANDITQNVFMTLWQEINKAGKLPAENMLAWLRKVANNRLSDYYKHRDVIRKRSIPLDEVIENTYSVVLIWRKKSYATTLTRIWINI